MIRLMQAEFQRLWKNRVFWGCMAFAQLFGLYVLVQRRMHAAAGPDTVFFFQAVVVGLPCAVLIALFLGTGTATARSATS